MKPPFCLLQTNEFIVYTYSNVSLIKVYNCSRLEYLSSNEVSVQQENIQNTPLEHSMLGHSVLKVRYIVQKH